MTVNRVTRGLRSAVLMVAALAATPAAFSQAVAAAYPNTVDIFGGGSYNEAFSPSSHEYGWDASITERPYPSHPWVGGTIEGSGAYSSTAAHGAIPAISNQFLTAMGGPAFVLNVNRIQPFARVLVGTGVAAERGRERNGCPQRIRGFTSRLRRAVVSMWRSRGPGRCGDRRIGSGRMYPRRILRICCELLWGSISGSEVVR